MTPRIEHIAIMVGDYGADTIGHLPKPDNYQLYLDYMDRYYRRLRDQSAS